MEFVIEEMEDSATAQKRDHYRIKRYHRWQAKFQSLKGWLIKKYQQFLMDMTLQKEFWVAGLFILLGITLLIGRDLVMMRQQQFNIVNLETKIRELSFKGRELDSEMMPLAMALQGIWLRNHEENLPIILDIVSLFVAELKRPFILTEIQKHAQDPHLYLQGIATTYEDIFHLESLFAMKKWQAIVTLAAKESDHYVFGVQILPTVRQVMQTSQVTQAQ